MRAEVIAIGDELTSGQRLDTNSRWLAAELGVLGVPVDFHTTAADTLEAGLEAFRIATGRADLVVATGGLGPTADDLTRDVLAAVAGTTLESSPEALAAVESRFARRGVAMPDSNRRQALFPRGSRIIPNPDGTAPGIDLVVRAGGRESRVFALPGVPAEMRVMWRESVAPAVLAVLPGAATILQRRIKVFGAGESAVEAMLPDLVRRGRDPAVGITVHEATITLRIAARGRDASDCRARIAPTEATIRDCLGDLVFGVEDDEIEDAALAACAAAGATVACAEVGTAGRVAALLAQAEARRGGPRPGMPAVFRGGVVLPERGTDGPDAPPSRAVGDLARWVRDRFGASLGVAVGGLVTDDTGRGRLDVAVATAAGCVEAGHPLGGAATLAEIRAAKTAVDAVRKAAAGGAGGAA